MRRHFDFLSTDILLESKTNPVRVFSFFNLVTTKTCLRTLRFSPVWPSLTDLQLRCKNAELPPIAVFYVAFFALYKMAPSNLDSASMIFLCGDTSLFARNRLGWTETIEISNFGTELVPISNFHSKLCIRSEVDLFLDLPHFSENRSDSDRKRKKVSKSIPGETPYWDRSN